ncbi:MAG: helix-turn-helix transcriptional regulator [Candidatus Kapabacteria bacterium]|nr:helix-turn-helix transcriptional regulator [Candidatus Kapabacteria bacterium]
MSESENILSGLISDEVSNWKTKAEYRIANKSWLDKSAIIALKILKHLKKEGTSQKQLAEMVNVSPQQINKIVKGSENLTLETISKIEDALGIKLVAVENFEQTMIYELPNSRVTKYGRLVKPTVNLHLKP